MAITLTTSAPATYKLREIVVGSPADFDTTQSTVADGTEPLALFPSQVYDYDSPLNVGLTTDATFGLFSVQFTADAAGSTTHTIQVDPAVTRVVYQKAGSRTRSTAVPTALAPTDTVYLWCSDHDRFPCSTPDCHLG
jgi:hypothetical protein